MDYVKQVQARICQSFTTFDSFVPFIARSEVCILRFIFLWTMTTDGQTDHFTFDSVVVVAKIAIFGD